MQPNPCYSKSQVVSVCHVLGLYSILFYGKVPFGFGFGFGFFWFFFLI